MSTLTMILGSTSPLEEKVQALEDRVTSMVRDKKSRRIYSQEISEYNSWIGVARNAVDHFTWKNKLKRHNIDTPMFPYRDISRLAPDDQKRYYTLTKSGFQYHRKLDAIEEQLDDLTRARDNKARSKKDLKAVADVFESFGPQLAELSIKQQFLKSLEYETLRLHKESSKLRRAEQLTTLPKYPTLSTDTGSVMPLSPEMLKIELSKARLHDSSPSSRSLRA